jgi:hypothetical protein
MHSWYVLCCGLTFMHELSCWLLRGKHGPQFVNVFWSVRRRQVLYSGLNVLLELPSRLLRENHSYPQFVDVFRSMRRRQVLCSGLNVLRELRSGLLWIRWSCPLNNDVLG